MTSANWQRVEQLFEEALEQPPAERRAWIDRRTGGDAALRDEVLRLLAAHERTGGILDRGLPPLIYDVTDHLQRAVGDRYRIERELGHGGSSIVYQAYEAKHGRRVVLKVLKPEVSAGLGNERFLREVQIAARLAHPHILGLIDSGCADDLMYYVMPYVPGETLRHRMDASRPNALPLSESFTLLRDIADALTYAHESGVVHRDLKPENILCAGGHAFVMDFGIAKIVAGTEGFASVSNTDQAIGTPAYMAPEQAVGDPSTDHRADVYAWGLIAHEIVTGRRPTLPRTGTTPRDAQKVPRELWTLIDACLAPEPDNRIACMCDIRDALDAMTAPAPVAKSLRRRAKQARTWRLAAGGSLAIAAAAVFWFSPAEPAPLPAPVAVVALTNETADSALGVWGRLAGDWITQGLQEAGIVPVIPWPSAAQASEVIADERRAGDVDLVKRMREETGAGLVVTGSYYLIGDSVHFQAQVANTNTGELYGALPPVAAHRRNPEVAVRELRTRLMGQMAIWFDERLASVPRFATRPPTYEAYQAFDRGMELYLDQSYTAATEQFHRAHLADTLFQVARVYESICLWNTGRFTELDSLLVHLAHHRGELSDYHEFQLRAIEALMQGDRARALEAEQRAAAMAPRSKAAYNVALLALELNRPREALTSLESLDPDRGAMRGWSSYWTALAHAHHLLGEHDREVEAARGMRQRSADRRVAWVLEARALAAAGRIAELDSMLAITEGLPARTYWSHGAALVVAGEELLAHGDSLTGIGYLERAREWLTPRHEAEPDYAAYREWLASSLYGLKRWSDAARVLAPFARDTTRRYQLQILPHIARYRATGGAVPELPDASIRDAGEMAFYRARLAAIAGDHDQAIAHLAEALRVGVDGFPWVHGSAHHDLAVLKDDARFQQLMAPDGGR